MNLTSFEVDGDTCIRCGLCVSDCVCDIIEMGDLPLIAKANLAQCIRSGHLPHRVDYPERHCPA